MKMKTSVAKQVAPGPADSGKMRIGRWAQKWGLRLLGLGVIWIGAQLSILLPLTQHMERLEGQVELLRRAVAEVNGQQISARKSADLLAALAEQGQHLPAAQAALHDLETLQCLLREQAVPAVEASFALENMIDVQDALLAGQDRTVSAGQEVASLNGLRQRLLEGQRSTLPASHALKQLHRLQENVQTVAAETEAAQLQLETLRQLTNELVAGREDTDASLREVDLLRALRTRLLQGQPETFAASVAVDQLHELQVKIQEVGAETEAAQLQLETLQQLTQELIRGQDQTEQAAAAANSLWDLTAQVAELNSECNSASTALEDVRTVQLQLAQIGPLARDSDRAVQHVVQLTRRLSEEMFDLEDAQVTLEGLIDLKTRLLAHFNHGPEDEQYLSRKERVRSKQRQAAARPARELDQPAPEALPRKSAAWELEAPAFEPSRIEEATRELPPLELPAADSTGVSPAVPRLNLSEIPVVTDAAAAREELSRSALKARANCPLALAADHVLELAVQQTVVGRTLLPWQLLLRESLEGSRGEGWAVPSLDSVEPRLSRQPADLPIRR